MIQRWLVIMAEDFKDLLKEGTRLLHSGRPKAAAKLLKTAHELNREHHDASLNLSGAYILMGSFKKAVPLLESLVDRNVANAPVFTNLGAAYLGNPVLSRDEDQQKAINAFKQALELDLHAPNVAYNIGLIYRDRREYDRAEKWFSKAIEDNPGDKDAENQILKMRKIKDNA